MMTWKSILAVAALLAATSLARHCIRGCRRLRVRTRQRADQVEQCGHGRRAPGAQAQRKARVGRGHRPDAHRHGARWNGVMAAAIVPLPSSEPGVYAFKAPLTMTGRWLLTVSAKVQGEPETVTGKVIFTVGR